MSVTGVASRHIQHLASIARERGVPMVPGVFEATLKIHEGA